jgi:hypothetical protein
LDRIERFSLNADAPVQAFLDAKRAFDASLGDRPVGVSSERADLLEALGVTDAG